MKSVSILVIYAGQCWRPRCDEDRVEGATRADARGRHLPRAAAPGPAGGTRGLSAVWLSAEERRGPRRTRVGSIGQT